MSKQTEARCDIMQTKAHKTAISNRKLAALAKLDEKYAAEPPVRWQMEGSHSVEAFSVLAHQNVCLKIQQ
jgi:hypothetical protein